MVSESGRRMDAIAGWPRYRRVLRRLLEENNRGAKLSDRKSLDKYRT